MEGDDFAAVLGWDRKGICRARRRMSPELEPVAASLRRGQRIPLILGGVCLCLAAFLLGSMSAYPSAKNDAAILAALTAAFGGAGAILVHCGLRVHPILRRLERAPQTIRTVSVCYVSYAATFDPSPLARVTLERTDGGSQWFEMDAHAAVKAAAVIRSRSRCRASADAR
jgi:hypothetical protein